jgi:aminoglycoside phosphotransferase (APT) family kinase protein
VRVASPCNAVFRGGVPVAFIDFDAAHPGARRDDVGYAAWLWLDLGNEDVLPELQGERLASFVRTYGALSLADAVPAVLDAPG